MLLPPKDELGSGRIIKTISFNHDKIHNFLKKKIKKKIDYYNVNIEQIIKKYDKEISLIKIYSEEFGLIILVIKEVFRTVRPKKKEMSIEELLTYWPHLCIDEFKKQNCYRILPDDKLNQRERYLISKSIYDVDKYLNPIEQNGLIQCSVSFISEYKNAKLLSQLFLDEICPNFVIYQHIKNTPYLLVQHCDSSLSTKIKIINCEQEKMSYFIQVLFSLYFMQEKYEMMHNDLFLYSIVVQNITNEMKWKNQVINDYNYFGYKLPNGKFIYLKNYRNFIKITDLGFACSYKKGIGYVREDIWSGQRIKIGFPNEFKPQCDIITFLMDFYLNYNFKTSFFCLSFISKFFNYTNLEEMFCDIFIPNQSYRIKVDKLEGLSAKLLLNNLFQYYPNANLIKIPKNKKVLYV